MVLITRGISVVICSYNGAAWLGETLRRLAWQRTPLGLKWELIVVDNNSTDQTAAIAKRVWQEAGVDVPITILHEPRPGLAMARKRGVNAARYEYLVFCDDDNRMAENYLDLAYQLLESNSEIGAVGGQSVAVAEVAFPEWFSGYSFGYAVGSQAEESGDVSSRGFVWGAGMCTRRSLLERFQQRGYRPLLSGRRGNELLAGDDSELCRWLLLEGYKLWYDSRLQFEHFIPQHRLTEEYRDGIFQGFSRSLPVLHAYDQVLADRSFGYRPMLSYAVGTSHLIKAVFSGADDKDLHRTRAQLRFGRRLRVTSPLFDVMSMLGI